MKELLGELVVEYSKKNTRVNCKNVYSVTNSSGFTPSIEYFSKEVFSKDLSNYKIVKTGMLAYNPSRINVGSIACLQDIDEVVVSPLYIVIKPDESKIYSRYLEYFMKSTFAHFQIVNLTSGSVRDSLKFSMFKKIKINLPTIDKQLAIVERLDKVCKIINEVESQIREINRLVKSRFIELFKNGNFNTTFLANVSEIASGITKGRKINDKSTRMVPYMAVSNVKSGYIDWSNVKTILATDEEIKQYLLEPDDVLMTEGGDPDKLGRGAIIKQPLKDCIHQNHIFRVRLDKKIVRPEYFAEYLKNHNVKQYFLQCAKQTTGIATINMKQLKALPVVIPPISLQNQFSIFINQTDK